jgi:hypothetical protein
VFLVADFGGERAEQVLALAEGVRGYSPKGRQARQGVAQVAGEGARSGRGYRMRAFGDYAEDDTASAMKQRDHKDATDLVVRGPATSGAVTSRCAKGGGPAGDEHYNLVAYGFYANEGSHGMGDNREVSPAIKIGSGLGIPSPPAVAFNWQEGPSGDLGMSDADTGGSPPVRVSQTLAVAHGLAPTLTATNDPSRSPQSTEITQQVAAVHEAASIVRRLTPVECCRLQGFPDDWNSEGIDAKGKRFSMADAPRYRQLGNAVTVNVANWIANNLVKAYEVAE